MAKHIRRGRVFAPSYQCEPLESRRLLAGPNLAWSSYLGGSDYDVGSGIAIDGSGSAWVVGYTDSSDLAMGGFDTSYNGRQDIFIAKINANGTLAWSSYLGGTGQENGGSFSYASGPAIAIDSAGNAWVTGQTASTDWAVGGFDTSLDGANDAFVAKINADGTLAWSSYLGGTGFEYGNGIAIDGSGNAWVSGITNSAGWTVGGFDTSFNGMQDAFVAKINANGTLAWSSYLGGTNVEGRGAESVGSGNSIAIDGSGSAWVTGLTRSADWTVGGFDTSLNDPNAGGAGDAFIAKINANGTLAWSSYLGGTESDYGYGIAIDGLGNAWVAGETRGGGWAVGGFDTSYNGGQNDAFIAKINANGTLAWSSYLGGTSYEYGNGIAIDGSGNAWVVGYTGSSGWTVGGFDTSYNGGDSDAFIAKINADGTLAWSSYLGGGGQFSVDDGYGIAIDGSDNAWVTGLTNAGGWAVGGFDTSYNGTVDAFIAKITDDVTPPAVTSASYFYDTAPNSVRLTFTEDVSPSLSATDLIVTAVPGGAPVSVSNFTYDSATNTATFGLPTPLVDGNYSARLPANAVSDLAGHPLAADYVVPFFVLAADANRDRKQDQTDLGILSVNWQQAGRSFSQGNFDYSPDGLVDVNDLYILASHWQQTLAAPVLSPAPPPTRAHAADR